MSTSYDLIVIGSGVAGSTVATTCRDAGWSVAVIDDRPFGGTCSQRGCDPKKVLVHAAHIIEEASRREGTGLAGDLHIDWDDLIAFKRDFVEDIPENTKEKFERQGIDTYRGQAVFTGEHTLRVSGTARTNGQADAEELTFDHVVIAAGAKPVTLGIPGEKHFTHSYDFLELEELPQRVVFVGGGYISCEFAHLCARAGAEEVHVIETGERILEEFDPDMADILTEATRDLGVNVHLNRKTTAIEQEGEEYVVVTESGEGTEQRIAADCVVHGAGRQPPLKDLAPEAGRIEWDGSTLMLNEYLQSVSNPAVYAAGDAAGKGLPLTPVAAVQGSAVACNLLSGNEQVPDYTATASAAFTTPRIASVGLSEAEAEAQDLDVTVSMGDASDWFSAEHRGERHAGYKVIVHSETDEVLGAHLVYPKAEEIINIFALAIRHSLTTDEVKDTLFVYPTSTADIKYML